MRAEYDFKDGIRNPYVKRAKKAVTIRLENDVVDYFKGLSGETGIPYQNLINLYLRDCAEQSRTLNLMWESKVKYHEAHKASDAVVEKSRRRKRAE